MDKGARRLEKGERRSFSRNVAVARRLRRRTGAIQEFRRARSVHRAIANAARARSHGAWKISFQLVSADKLLLVESEDDSDRLEARPSESGKMPDFRLFILPLEMLPQF